MPMRMLHRTLSGTRDLSAWSLVVGAVLSIGLVSGLFGGCSGPTQDPGEGPALVAEGDLPTAEWVHHGSTWTWAHPVSEGFRWAGPRDLRGAWMPVADAPARGTPASHPLERVEVEAGQTVARAGLLVAPRLEGTARSKREPRLVVWIVADTLRADVAEQELTLHERFDARLRFTRAFAPAAWTLPSVASMFTGLAPASLRGPSGELIVLPTVVPTVAEQARERGFVTVAVVANPTVNHDNGFSRGFDRFTVPSYAEGWTLPDATWVEEQAMRELDAFEGDDLFLLLHFMDPHDPYRDHESGESFVPPPSGPQAEALGADEVASMFRAYRSEARHLDRVLQRLWRELEQRRTVDLMVVTADHGEEFLDHGGTRHGPTVLPEVSRVPLWIGGAMSDALARRLEREGVGPETPTSLTTVGTLLLQPDSWVPGGLATVESRVHGPPRFAWIGAPPSAGATPSPVQHWSLGSRWLTPRAPEDGVESWLRGQPPLFAEPVERPPDGSGAQRWSGSSAQQDEWSRVPDATWLDLIDQLSGMAPGRWVFWRRHERFATDLAALAESTWAMGPCAESEPPAGAGLPCLAYLGPDAPAPFEHAPPQRRWVLDVRPERLPPEGAVSWLEATRDSEVPQDVSRTMERLRALGYIQ